MCDPELRAVKNIIRGRVRVKENVNGAVAVMLDISVSRGLKKRGKNVFDIEGGKDPLEVRILIRGGGLKRGLQKALAALDDAHGRKCGGGLAGGLGKVLAQVGGMETLVFHGLDVDDGTHTKINPLQPEPLLRDVFTAAEDMEVRGVGLGQLPDKAILEGADP